MPGYIIELKNGSIIYAENLEFISVGLIKFIETDTHHKKVISADQVKEIKNIESWALWREKFFRKRR